jgi:hypothetical protein
MNCSVQAFSHACRSVSFERGIPTRIIACSRSSWRSTPCKEKQRTNFRKQQRWSKTGYKGYNIIHRKDRAILNALIRSIAKSIKWQYCYAHLVDHGRTACIFSISMSRYDERASRNGSVARIIARGGPGSTHRYLILLFSLYMLFYIIYMNRCIGKMFSNKL